MHDLDLNLKKPLITQGAIFEVPHYKEYVFQYFLNAWVINECERPRMLTFAKITSAKPDQLERKLAATTDEWDQEVLFEVWHAEAEAGSRSRKAKPRRIEQVSNIYHVEGNGHARVGPVRVRLCWENKGQLITASMACEDVNYEIMTMFSEWLDSVLPVKRKRAEAITVDFRYLAGSEVANVQRSIDACAWGEIRDNYATGAQESLDELFTRTGQDFSTGGKIGILHGEPGTGKTHLIRALAKEWHKWARIEYIIDVDQFFGSAPYMMEILMHGQNNVDQQKKWNVIICEDSEEYLTPDSKGKVGQALSRLLNVGDGLVGQGLRILFLFTTNAPGTRLHPAIVREGRCFADYEIPLLSASQATSWLGEPVYSETSLADLYARREKKTRLSHDALPRHDDGQYL